MRRRDAVTGAPVTPAPAAEVRDAVAEARGGDEPFDLCVWVPADQADQFEASGVTWLVQAAGPEDSLAEWRRIIDEGTPGPKAGEDMRKIRARGGARAGPAP